eukprot:CAMPEP_0174722598 /NCGR_PEP_ID=MMETSP1094-20130205/38835_1 /TAXON_ID=156173 /ORGANISM="Chrysochromulina brevifilum, Strain UTEX LB 985" /LENGTH=294 /DNA_ID=CAMNT_0015923487 /DNA_START=53 /DNA_END=935 /DNA_ORIENTATION=+
MSSSSAIADKEGRKVFLGGIAYETQAEDLRKDFGKYGDLEDVQLPIGDGKNHKGFAFLTYRSADDAAYACKEHHQREYMGREISAKIVVPREQRGGDDALAIGLARPAMPMCSALSLRASAAASPNPAAAAAAEAAVDAATVTVDVTTVIAMTIAAVTTVAMTIAAAMTAVMMTAAATMTAAVMTTIAAIAAMTTADATTTAAVTTAAKTTAVATATNFSKQWRYARTPSYCKRLSGLQPRRAFIMRASGCRARTLGSRYAGVLDRCGGVEICDRRAQELCLVFQLCGHIVVVW